MGNAAPNLKKQETDELISQTHFSTKELKDLHKQFKKEAPQGTIVKKDFRVIMKGMGFDEPFIQDLIFGAFDQDRDGLVTFKEFITALSTLTRGSPDEKIEFTFRMYDVDNLGYLTKESFLKILDSFFKLVGPLVTFAGKKYESAEQLVEEVFEEMNPKGDGKITLEDYKVGATKNPDIIQGLKLFTD